MTALRAGLNSRSPQSWMPMVGSYAAESIRWAGWRELWPRIRRYRPITYLGRVRPCARRPFIAELDKLLGHSLFTRRSVEAVFNRQDATRPDKISDSMPTMNKMDWDEAKHIKYYKAKYGEKIDEYSEEE